MHRGTHLSELEHSCSKRRTIHHIPLCKQLKGTALLFHCAYFNNQKGGRATRAINPRIFRTKSPYSQRQVASRSMGCYTSIDEQQESLYSVEVVETKATSQVKRPSILRNGRFSSQYRPHADSTLHGQLRKSCYHFYDPPFSNEAGTHLAPRSTISISPGSSDDIGDEFSTLGAVDAHVYVNPIASQNVSLRTTTSILNNSNSGKCSEHSSCSSTTKYTGRSSCCRRSRHDPLLLYPSSKEILGSTANVVTSTNIRKRNHVTFSHDSLIHSKESKNRRASELEGVLRDLFRGPDSSSNSNLN
mmetsp:Transcript_22882/g.38324  ORF Transcript_22882/g.38324 Transcript_22882/m.38324 type:complete len:302 (+) Transcript_22882:2-907(+)